MHVQMSPQCNAYRSPSPVTQGKAKKTRKFGLVKRLLGSNDIRL
jgi:hypothetical protein